MPNQAALTMTLQESLPPAMTNDTPKAPTRSNPLDKVMIPQRLTLDTPDD